MVTKAKGEFETTAIKREVDKHVKMKKKKVKANSDDESEEEEEEEEDPEEQAADSAPKREPKMKADDEEKTYEIEVDKSSGEVFLGITWKVTSSGFEIQSLNDEGLIAKWNEENEDKVAVYDMIVAVNDEG